MPETQKVNTVIDQYIQKIVSRWPLIRSIWLFGSRVNDTYRDDSDWDLLLFGSQKILDQLHSSIELYQSGIDLFVVYNNKGDFKNPWENPPKTGNLKKWSWSQTSNNKAKYRSEKITTGDSPISSNIEYVQEVWAKAVKKWPIVNAINSSGGVTGGARLGGGAGRVDSLATLQRTACAR